MDNAEIAREIVAATIDCTQDGAHDAPPCRLCEGVARAITAALDAKDAALTDGAPEPEE